MENKKEVKTNVSPFAVRSGEVKIFAGSDKQISINDVMYKVNIGQIDDISFKILQIVSKFENVSTKQISDSLKLFYNIELKPERLTRKLENLINNRIITRYYFSDGKQESNYRVFALEKNGKYLLRSMEIETNWQPTDNARPVYLMKKRLATNQMVLAYKQKVKSFVDFELRPTIKCKVLRRNFKPNANIDLKYKDNNIRFTIEVVRRNEGWENKLLEKMKLYESFYHNFTNGDSGYIIFPQLIFLCEDFNHMVETFKVLTKTKLINNVKFYFTTDLVQTMPNLSKSLCSFEINPETNKFNIKNLDLPLLG